MPTRACATRNNEERAALLLSELFEDSGYKRFRMSKFEEYDFYSSHKDFLPSSQILTFTGLDGKLMALRPDVTMSIVKRTRATPTSPERLYYSERIYRPSADAREYIEIPQMGAEFIGRATREAELEMASLALKSLELASDGEYALDISHMGFAAGLLDGLSPDARHDAQKRLAARDPKGLAEAVLADSASETDAQRIASVLTLPWDLSRRSEALAGARAASNGNRRMLSAVDEAEELLEALVKAGAPNGAVRVDFSLALNAKYYNGLVFKGYAKGAPRAVLAGGRYDNLLRRIAARSAGAAANSAATAACGLEAIGFALYLNELPLDACNPDAVPDSSPNGPATSAFVTQQRHAEAGAKPLGSHDEPLRVALPKGRMGDKAYRAFSAAGLPYDAKSAAGRKLEIPDETGRVRYLLIKPQDVPVYVERGAADIGVAGKDVLLEGQAQALELRDLGFGACRLAVAAPNGRDALAPGDRPLRVATKYPRVARGHFSRIGQDIDVIKLNGSIELAPLLGLADVIVDIVETGATLKENGLSVIEGIAESSARLIANEGSYAFRRAEIDALAEAVAEAVAPVAPVSSTAICADKNKASMED